MNPILVEQIVNGLFLLAQAKVEQSAVVAKLQGVPVEQYPAILDAMHAEAKAKRDEAIAKAE
jgi:hypothetical protein